MKIKALLQTERESIFFYQYEFAAFWIHEIFLFLW